MKLIKKVSSKLFSVANDTELKLDFQSWLEKEVITNQLWSIEYSINYRLTGVRS